MADLSSVYEIVGEDLLSPAAESAAGSLDRLNEKTGIAGTAFSALGTIVAGAGVAIAGGLAGAISTAASFQQNISNIGAVAGATADQMKQISDTAIQLGAQTSFSANEAAQGMEELLKAGVSITDVIGGGAKAALDLAAAGGLSVAEAATIASTSMNTFSIAGADAGHVADVIAGAANASAIDVHDFGFSMSAAGAVAATVGLSFDDTATAIAVLGQAGLRGSDAGTSLKTMLLNLNPTSKAATAEMRTLGIITADGANQFFDAEGKVKSFDQVAQVLQNSMQGLTKEQQINALQTAFGTDAIRAAAIMAKAGAAGFNEMAGAMGNVTAADVAAARMDNLKGAIQTLEGSMETAAIVLGNMFLPALQRMAEGATTGVNNVITILQMIPDALTSMQATMSGGGDNAAGDALMTALGLGPNAIAAVNAALLTVGDAWRTLGQVFAGDWSPDSTIDPIVNAVGMIGIIIRDQVIPAFQAAGAFITANASTIEGALAGVAAVLTAIWVGGGIVTGITAVGLALAAILSPIGLVIAASALLGAAWVNDWGGIRETTADFLAWFNANLPTMQAAAQTSFAELTATVQTAMANIGTALHLAQGIWRGDWSAAWTDLTTIASAQEALQQSQSTAHGQAMVAIIDNWTGGAATSFDTWTTTTASALATWATTTAGDFSTWATQAAGAISTWATTAFGAISTWVTDTETAISGWATTAVTTVTTWGTDAAAAATTAVTLISSAITTAWGAIQTTWTAGWALLETIQTGAWNLLTPENQAKILELEGLIGTLWTTLTTLWTTGTAAVTTLVTNWWNAGVTLWTTQTAALSTLITTWWTAFGALWTTGTTAVTTTTTTWWAALATLWTTSTAAITAIITPWLTAASALWVTMETAVTTTATTWWGSLATLWTTSVAALGTAISTQLATWTKFFTDEFTAIGGTITAAATTLAADATALGTSIVNAIIASINAAIGGIASALITGVKGAIGAATSIIPTGGGSGGTGSGGGAQTLSYRPGGGSASVNAGPIDNSSRASFVQTAYPYALQAANGDPGLAQRLLASAISENGTVGSGGAIGVGNNFGGIKYDPQASGSGNYGTWEQENGQHVNQNANFAAYNTPQEGFAAIPRFIQTNFPQAWAEYQRTGDAAALYSNINRGGYATNPNWHNDIESIVSGSVAPNIPATNPAGMQRLPLDGWPTAVPDATGAMSSRLPLTGNGATGQLPVAGAMQGVIALTPQFTAAAGQVEAAGTAAFTGVLTSSTDMGNGVTLVISQFGTQAVAQMTDASGQIIGVWGSQTQQVTDASATMAAAVPPQYEAMSSSALTSVTNLGTGTLTTITDSAGTTVATVTDMNGNVTSQYATMANGVNLTMGDMAGGVLTSTTNLGTGVLTTVQDMSGNTIATVTDMAGNVTSQYTTLGTAVQGSVNTTAAAVETTTAGVATTVPSQYAGMATAVLTSVTDLGSGILTSTTDSAGTTIATVTDLNGQVTSQYATMANGVSLTMGGMETGVLTSVTDLHDGTLTTVSDMSGNTIATITDMTGHVTSQYSTMGSDVAGSAATMDTQASGSAASMATNVGGSVDSLSTPLDDLSTGFDDAGSAAQGAVSPSSAFASAVDKVGKASGTAAPPTHTYAGAAAEVQPVDVGSSAKDIEAVGKAADKAVKSLDAFAKAGGGPGKKLVSSGDSSNDGEGHGGSKGGGGKAAGGPVHSDATYLVGEQGPELFRPTVSGEIIPNHRLRGLAEGGYVQVGASAAGSYTSDGPVPVQLEGDALTLLEEIHAGLTSLADRAVPALTAIGQVGATAVSLLQGIATALTHSTTPGGTTGTRPPGPAGPAPAGPAPAGPPSAALPAGYEYKQFSPGVWGVQPKAGVDALAGAAPIKPGDLGPVAPSHGVAAPGYGGAFGPGTSGPAPSAGGVARPGYGGAFGPGTSGPAPSTGVRAPGYSGAFGIGTSGTAPVTTPLNAADATVKKLSADVAANTFSMSAAATKNAVNMASKVSGSSDSMRNDVGDDVSNMASDASSTVQKMGSDVVTFSDLMRQGALTAAGLMSDGVVNATEAMNTGAVGSDGWITKLKVQGVDLASDLNTGVTGAASALSDNLNKAPNGAIFDMYSRGVRHVDALRSESIDLIGGNPTGGVGMVRGMVAAMSGLNDGLNGTNGQIYLTRSAGVSHFDQLRNSAIDLMNKAAHGDNGKSGVVGSFGEIKTAASGTDGNGGAVKGFTDVESAGSHMESHVFDPKKWVDAIGKIQDAADKAKTAINNIPSGTGSKSLSIGTEEVVRSQAVDSSARSQSAVQIDYDRLAASVTQAFAKTDTSHPVYLSLTVEPRTQEYDIVSAQTGSAT